MTAAHDNTVSNYHTTKSDSQYDSDPQGGELWSSLHCEYRYWVIASRGVPVYSIAQWLSLRTEHGQAEWLHTTHNQAVTHASINRARRRLTVLAL